MADEPEEQQSLKEKLLFYTTAFFILLGTFSLFAFLFLVPFVIDPAFTTIFMQFDTTPALCFTTEVQILKGVKNCTWTSCKEGCTKDIYECTQIRVNYKLAKNDSDTDFTTDPSLINVEDTSGLLHRAERGIRDYDYFENSLTLDSSQTNDLGENMEYPELKPGRQGNNSEWFFVSARLFPNVKGCGYPPILNCTIWHKKYVELQSNYSCYYSKIDPGLVISDLDMWQNTLNLVYAMAIPIPSFIASVIYLAFAYFFIYNEDEELVPLDKNAEDIASGDDINDEQIVKDDLINDEINEINDNENNEQNSDNNINLIPNGGTALTPNSDLASFGHQLKVKMADEMSRDSIDAGLISNSGSIPG